MSPRGTCFYLQVKIFPPVLFNLKMNKFFYPCRPVTASEGVQLKPRCYMHYMHRKYMPFRLKYRNIRVQETWEKHKIFYIL